MKKLLFFASDYNIGLSELLLDELIAIHNAKCDYIAIAGDKEQVEGLWDKAKMLKLNLLKIEHLDEHKRYISLVNEVKEICVKYRVNVVHVQNNWQLALISGVRFFPPILKSIKVVYTLHGFRNNHPIKAKLAQVLIGISLAFFATHVQCMSYTLQKKFRLLGNKIIMLPIGINSEYFIPKIKSYTENNSLRIIYPAQFRKGKNQDLIIQAFKKHCENNDDKKSKLILPGDGPLLNKCRDLTIKMGMSEQIIFTGRISREKIKELIIESNLAVIASSSETFGQCIVEPFVLGRTVLSTPVGIATELIKNGVNGFIFHSEEELTCLMDQLYKIPSLLTIIGEYNFYQRNKFRWEIIINRYKELFLS